MRAAAVSGSPGEHQRLHELVGVEVAGEQGVCSAGMVVADLGAGEGESMAWSHSL